jgi:cytochrome b involved in lipid metabolism
MAFDTAEEITVDELKHHDNIGKGVWITIAGQVYDVSTFLDEHPGGSDILLEAAGTDATEDFFDLRKSTSPYVLPS